jgi:hypothetical protein
MIFTTICICPTGDENFGHSCDFYVVIIAVGTSTSPGLMGVAHEHARETNHQIISPCERHSVRQSSEKRYDYEPEYLRVLSCSTDGFAAAP